MDKLELAIKKKEKEKKTFDDYLYKYITEPNKRSYRVWQVFVSISYTVGYFSDAFNLSFHMLPILGTGTKLLTSFRSIVMLLDVILTFTIALPKETKLTLNDSHDDPKIRKRERQGNNV